MRVSLQRLGDNPRDHDGKFAGFKDDAGDVPGAKPDATEASIKPPEESPLSPWKIYPPPPPPHWKWKPQDQSNTSDAVHGNGDIQVEQFDFSKCHIPDHHDWVFELDEKGVYQLYDSEQSNIRDFIYS